MSSTPRTILTSLILLAIGVTAAYFLLRTAPTTEPVSRQRAAKLVQTIALTPRKEDVVVIGYGNVIPARLLTIQPQVSGRITSQQDALVPGGLIKEGDEILSIDRSDYELALAERRAAREDAVFELEIEQGRQKIAARELEELKKDLQKTEINPDLVLRQPHLRRAQAMVDQADNAIAKAELDLTRCTIKAPFNALVLDESIELTQLVATGGDIATLVGTDAFWIRVSLPMTDLQRVRLPSPGQPGASARIILDTADDAKAIWTGEVTRLLGDLENSGRMARVLVTVPDPLGLAPDADQALPLLLGSYVRVEIKAGTLEDVLEIPRSALRAGDRVWLVGDDKLLQIRKADVLWRRRNTVLITNFLAPDERLVVSELKAPLPNMELDPQPLQEGGSAPAEAPPDHDGNPSPAP